MAEGIMLIIILGLGLLSAVSFTLFIRRLLINTSNRSANNLDDSNLERKLDRIIELLEEKKNTDTRY